MHIKCSGLSIKNFYHPKFVCKHCCEHANLGPQETAKRNPAHSIEATRTNAIFGKNLQDEQIETLREIYNEIVHWKPVLFTVSKNKIRFKIANSLNIMLTKMLQDGPHTECAMISTMIMHLLLAKSKS